jgi:predicted nucleic acid-binding protein
MNRYLLDTNVLLRAVNESHPQHQVAQRSVAALATRGDLLCITPQVIIEFWSVASRPTESNGGFGWDAARLRDEVQSLLDQFPLVEDGPRVFREWVRLTALYSISGKVVHDARLVAVIQASGLSGLVTFNTTDFKRYAGLEVIHPADAASLSGGE